MSAVGVRRTLVAAVAAIVLIATHGAVASVAQRSVDSTIDNARLSRIDAVVTDAIAAHQLPGAVAVVGRGETVLFRKAYGNRAVAPATEPMTLDTIFDLASMTKIVATAPAVMLLVEEGRIRLADPVVTYIPEFAKNGKDRITVRDLLTHMSGLRPDLDLGPDWKGYGEAIRLACEETPTDPPGRRFVYSDINFFLLGEIVARVSGRPFADFVRDRILVPLDMRETTFLPAASLIPRIAPTEPCTLYGWPCTGPGMQMLRGVVHDPTARRMGGVAGHAGLFSTAADIVKFARMWIGATSGRAPLSPLTIARMTSPATPTAEPNVRGLGWDIDSTYSSPRGEFFPVRSFGHTGFTGTSIWIDPASRMFVILLSNRLHPDGKGNVTALRARIATIAAADARSPGSSDPGAAIHQPVLAGIDVLREDGFRAIAGMRVGLLTNQIGRARDGASTIDLIAAAPGVKLAKLFSPEHGIRGVLDDAVPESVDEKTGVPIHSIFGKTSRPTAEMLSGLDAIVIDLQDIGSRFYTYMSSMAYVMEEAAPRKIKVIVLDRPNPIGGLEIEGPSLDEAAVGFTGYVAAMPNRHGLTMGELARLFNGEKKIGADLTVIGMRNWRREQWFDETGLAWINPSPAMRTQAAAMLYPGIGSFEQINLAVGRGTDTPFEQVGAPWIDGVRLAEALNARRLAGVRFYPVRFTPTARAYSGTECQGVFITITDRLMLRPVRVAVEIVSAIVKLYPNQLDLQLAARQFGSAAGLARIQAGDDPEAIAQSWRSAETKWRELRAKYLIYR